MKQRRSKVIVGVGVLCFVGVMAVWLASSGDKAIADAEKVAITKTVAQDMVNPVALDGKTVSEVTFAETEGVVHGVKVQVDIKSANARNAKVYLTSPSGTKVLLADGERTRAVTAEGLKARFGEDQATVQSLAAFAGEPVAGAWKLTVEGAQGRLVKWSLSADLSSNTKMAGMETYGEYGGDGGCDCRVGQTRNVASAGLLSILGLLGLALLRRR